MDYCFLLEELREKCLYNYSWDSRDLDNVFNNDYNIDCHNNTLCLNCEYLLNRTKAENKMHSYTKYVDELLKEICSLKKEIELLKQKERFGLCDF